MLRIAKLISRYLAKANGTLHGITPSFMAKSRGGYGSGNLGCSMHIHISLVDDDGKGLFYRETADDKAPYPELSRISDVGRQFLAGLLDGLADCLPMLAPTINSYKRLDKRAFTPVTSSWGLEHRAAAVRIVAPPTASANSTRFEVRVPGADANPHLVLAAILAMGWRGVEKKLSVTIPPLGEDLQVESEADKGDRFPENLKDATERFMRKDGVARELFGEEFVEHFGASRMHEVELWKEAITDWEMRRYVETV